MSASQAIHDSDPVDVESTHPLEEIEDCTPRLEVRELTLAIDTRVVLDGIGFEVAPGQSVAILGPRGAGKTSLMNCLCGLVKATKGTAWLDGERLSHRTGPLRARIGMVFQKPSLDLRLTAHQNIVLGGRLFGLKTGEARKRAEQLLTFMELAEDHDVVVSRLTPVVRRRLELARALIADPELLLLDEPTAGFDAAQQERTWDRLSAIRAQRDVAIVVATNDPAEAMRCDRVVIFDRGHVVLSDTPENLMQRVPGDVLELDSDHPASLVADLAEAFRLQGRVDGRTVVVETHAAHELVPRLVEAFEPDFFTGMRIRRPSLSDAFCHLTGHTLESCEEGTP